MKFLNNKIEINRELSDLDKFTIEFIRILKKHSKYVIVSGYVAILLGRSRASEDVDIIIPKMEQSVFHKLLKELKETKFYCLNAEIENSIYGCLREGLAVRFAKEKTVIPNIELKFAKNKFDEIALKNIIFIRMDNEEIIISHLELQIAFKENVLGSAKDLEDARHIRNIAKEHLNSQLIKKYEAMLNEFY